MLTCNSNRVPIRSTTRAFFQIDMVPCVFLVWPRYLGNANLICGMRDCTQIVNQTIDLCECFSKGLRMTCCISLCSLGVYFTDSDTGIYSKGVRDMRAFCVNVIGKTTRTQYPSSHSRISQTFVQFTIIVTLKIRISIDYVMRSFFLLGYPSNMCAVRATWPLVDELLLLELHIIRSLSPIHSTLHTFLPDTSWWIPFRFLRWKLSNRSAW